MNNQATLELDMDYFVEEFSHCFTGECRVKMLPLLYKISQIITDSANLANALSIILGIMQQHLKMERGIVTLYDMPAENIFIHDSFGLTEEEQKRGVYTLGEGITGKVVETGKAIIARRVQDHPDFSDRTEAQRSSKAKSAFFCVPIMRARKVLGTIAAERVYMNQRLLKQDVELLTMIATMIAPVVELYLIENIDKVRLENENRRLKHALKERFKPTNIIGNSKPMQEVYELIHKVASTKATVLILGESGVGKELVANAIHYNSPNAEAPFITSNCAALPENLAESELFGHEKGSFTGALSMHKGC